MTSTVTAGIRRHRRQIGWAGVLAAVVLSALAVFGIARPASAHNPTYQTTDAVSARSTPTAAATGVYGIPKGASFVVSCQILGEGVGPRGNRLYFLTDHGGKQMYVPDYYTNSPHMAADPPIAGIPMCGAAAPTPAPAPPPAPAPAPSGRSYATTDAVSARSGPTSAPTGVSGLPKGATFNVECQVLGEPVGPRGNKLYFRTTYGGRQMFVPDYFTNSPHMAADPPLPGIPMCSTATGPVQGSSPALQGSSPCLQAGCPTGSASTPATRALAWAWTQVGRWEADPATTAAYTKENWAPGKPGQWGYDCVKLVHRAYVMAGGASFRRAPTATAIYQSYKASRLIQQGNPPAGAAVFWPSINHVAIAVGDGRVISTMGNDFDKQPVAAVPISRFGTPAGWVLP